MRGLGVDADVMPRRHPTHRLPSPLHLLALGVVLLACLLAPAGAAAHASLQESVPADGTVVEVAPDEVVLEFSGRVSAGSGSIRVFAPDEQEVQVGAPTPTDGTRITQRIDASAAGTYGVSYVVASEDGHVINGATTFSVGEPSTGTGSGAAASREAATVPRSLQLAFSATRLVEILALLVVAGGGLFACIVAPSWRPRLLVPGLVMLLAAYAAAFVVTSAILHGGMGDAFAGDALRSTADTAFGRTSALRSIVALVALGPVLLLRSRVALTMLTRVAMSIVFVGLAASLSITGHAVTTEPVWLRLPLDMVHVVAAAIWLGGLVQVALLAPFATTYVAQVVRFSHLAFASVAALLATGVYATWAELGTDLGGLVDSTYGRLILAKLALYLGVMPLAYNNMRVFVPAIRRRPEDAPQMLRQYAWRELALVVVVVALTVWLIATPQPA
jgi:copper transport protein